MAKQLAQRMLTPTWETKIRHMRDAWELVQPRQFLLLNTHMRSYSSLLSHLLASSGEVCGYAEMRRAYRAEVDLLALAWQVRSTNGARLTGPVVLDKLLHNPYVVTDEVLRLPNVSILVSVRSPMPTIRSIMAMGRDIEPSHFWSSVDNATQYYVDRLAYLADIVERAQNPLVLFSDQLLVETEITLRELQLGLGLREELQESYPLRELTGVAEFGDTSNFIRAGKIVRERSSHEVIDICPTQTEEAHEAFRSFWERVRNNGANVVGA